MKHHSYIVNTAFAWLSLFVIGFVSIISVISKKMKPNSLVFFAFLILPVLSFSQLTVVNDGLTIKNTNDSVIIFGSIIHQGTGVNIENEGDFYITGDWTNTSNTSVFASGPNGWVHLDSANQTIGGTFMTHFNNLELAGSGTKFVSGGSSIINVEVEDTLALNDRELSAGDNTVFVLSTDSFAVTHSDTTGFVSNTNDGGLSRNTLLASTYLFPVGSTSGTSRYRPVELKPNEPLAHTFKVRMANDDPDNENYLRTSKEATVGEINQKFFHKIERTSGASPVDVTVYYKDTVDGDAYDIIANWEDLSEWKNPGLAVPSSNYGYKSLTIAAFDNFTGTTGTPFALSHNVEIGGEVYVANVFSPNGDGFNDFLFVRGKAILELQFMIYDRWGEKVFETNDVNTGWDGTYKGDAMNLAVFVYVVKGKFKNGDEIDQKGNVTLLR